jgi:hypothetical protein
MRHAIVSLTCLEIRDRFLLFYAFYVNVALIKVLLGMRLGHATEYISGHRMKTAA